MTETQDAPDFVADAERLDRLLSEIGDKHDLPILYKDCRPLLHGVIVELERLQRSETALTATIRAYPEAVANSAANLAHARAQRDEMTGRVTELRGEVKELYAKLASHENGCEHEAWESKHFAELTLVKAERDNAAHDAEVALTERIVSRLLGLAKGVSESNPAMRDGLLLAAGEAKIERLYEPDGVLSTTPGFTVEVGDDTAIHVGCPGGFMFRNFASPSAPVDSILTAVAEHDAACVGCRQAPSPDPQAVPTRFHERLHRVTAVEPEEDEQ